MTGSDVVVDVLLGLAALVVAVSSIGVLVMRDAYRKLHFVAPISMVAPVLVALAVSVRSGWSESTGATWLAVAFVAAASPFLSHATVRAARIRERGDWSVVDHSTGGSAETKSP